MAQATLQICTASLTMITVNGKQMTLSVFRQLVDLCPFSWDEQEGRFVVAGELWGTVNYHWKECPFEGGQMEEHRHVVWLDEGGELRRFTMRQQPTFSFEGERHAVSYPWGILVVRERRDVAEDVRYSVDPVFGGRNVRAPTDTGRQREVLTQWFAAYDEILALSQLFIAV